MDADSNAKRQKVCISMVTYSQTADQNFEHDIDFVRRLARLRDVSLIIERGGVEPDVPVQNIFVQKTTSRLQRILQHLLIVLRVRLSGTRTFYSRNSLMNANLGGLVARLSGGRAYLWSCGELDKGRASTRQEKGFLPYLMERAAYFSAFRMITGLVTGTATMKAYYADNLGIPAKKIVILPNWVDLTRFVSTREVVSKVKSELGLSEDSFVLIFPRSLSERHGTKYLPELVHYLVKSGVNAVLLATGRGKLEGWLRENFADRGMSDRLNILGGVPNLEMPAYFALSDITVLPSQTEGFPRVILESMAVGTPFVAHNVGGIRDIISPWQKENLVSVGDMQAFGDAVARFNSDPDWRATMIAEGDEWVKQYDVDPVVRSFASLFADGSISHQ